MQISAQVATPPTSKPTFGKAITVFTDAKKSLAFNEFGKLPSQQSISEAIKGAQAGIELLAPYVTSADQRIREAATEASRAADSTISPLQGLVDDPFYTRSIFSKSTVEAAQKSFDSARGWLFGADDLATGK